MDTLENKAKFFAQYWYQFVGFRRFHVGRDEGRLVSVKCENLHEIDYLELKPLSSISDEDAIESINLEGHLFGNIKVSKNKLNQTIVYWGDKGEFSYPIKPKNLTQKQADYLRSKGYALDWNGITVEQQIEYGWIKLKTTDE